MTMSVRSVDVGIPKLGHSVAREMQQATLNAPGHFDVQFIDPLVASFATQEPSLVVHEASLVYCV